MNDTAPPILEMKNVTCRFRSKPGLFRAARRITAIRDVNLRVAAGENFGIVGESGSGKSTLLRAILGLVDDVEGEILINGRKLSEMDRLERVRIVQPVFQDPNASLNPRHLVADIIARPLRYQGRLSTEEIARKTRQYMDLVSLPARCANAYPEQLSGGQKQRVAVARALIVEPKLVVCDEPTSALDVSVQAQILNLLDDMQRELGVTYVMVSHNLAVIEQIARNVAVMYLGRIIESAPSSELFSNPQHPYSKALLSSNLTPEVGRGLPQIDIGMTFPDPANPPAGCAFHPRCPEAVPACSAARPALLETAPGHEVACSVVESRRQG